MKNYWSCSKFADWIRGTPKPMSETMEGWNVWTQTAKEKKWRYWLAEEGLDHLQNFIFFPTNLLNDLRYYVDNRWISKTHALTSKLKKGQYHEFDTRLLHAAFDELIDFVEIELAWLNIILAGEQPNKYKIPWCHKVFQLRLKRFPEAGLDYLNWAANLKHDELSIEKNHPDFGKQTNQALAAQEILLLYKWWKEERPQRPDPNVVSGWLAYHKANYKIEKNNENLFLSTNQSEEDTNKKQAILELCWRIEKEQEDEDTAMLIRLIKLRSHIWT